MALSLQNNLVQKNRVLFYDTPLENKIHLLNNNVKTSADSAEFYSTSLENETVWIDEQVTRFDGLLRENFSKNLEDFTQNILTGLCESTHAGRGVFFIKQKESASLKALSGYACSKKILRNTIFEMGEGLVGQAASAQKEIYFNDLSKDTCYQEFAGLKVNIFGLLFMPLVFNDQVYGVLELAYLHKLTPKYLFFLRVISKNIAIMMESIVNHTATQELLIVTQKQKELLNEREEELNQNLEEMTAMHEIVREQSLIAKEAYDKLEKSNAGVLESIRYAKHIQEAILPGEATLNAAFAGHFLIYRPKDIVSGDFYWFMEVKTKKFHKKFIAVIDCTGHGVPGAFMSMIANTLLNQIVVENKIYQPGRILDALHEKIKTTLRHGDSKSKDGMDLMICCIESGENHRLNISFAGAKCNLYYSSEGAIHMLAGDRKSIGEMTLQDHINFSEHQFESEKHGILYLTTDGLIDMCNSDRVRFGRKRWEKLLNHIQHLPLTQQKSEIEHEMNSFLQGGEQRDDITLITIQL